MAKTLIFLCAAAAATGIVFACSSGSNGGNGSGGDAGSGVTFSCTVGGSLCTQVLAPPSAMSGELNACNMQMGTFATAACPTAGSLGCCLDMGGVEEQCVYDTQTLMVVQMECTQMGRTWIPSEAGAGVGATAFVGTWARSGMQTVTCPTGNPTTNAVTGNLVIALGSASDSLAGTQPDGCVTSYTVSGNVATAATGQSCNVTTDGGIAETVTVMSHTLTLSADGKSLASMSSSTIDKTATGTMCTATASGTYAKQ